MTRAIQLGANALGTAAPNPMVGAVLVLDGKIIGEGYTSAYGGPHAEANAIGSIKDPGQLSEATLYVTLEPCSHFGKTPPCTDLILKHTIPRVFIGITDPHEKVAGKGIERLQKAGCQVHLGLLEEACREHHRRFLSVHEKQRPYIILKWAQSADGFLAPEKEKRKMHAAPYWISNLRSRQLVHQWRSQEQAILVGSNTVLEDNPKLNLRLWKGKLPLRILLDKELKVTGNYHLLDRSQPTLIMTRITDPSRYLEGLTYEVLDFERTVASQVCALLMKHEVGSLIVEGGRRTLQTFIDEGLWDEARIFTGPARFGGGLEAPYLKGRVQDTVHIEDTSLTILRHD